MPRSGYDMGKHSSESGARSAGTGTSSGSQKHKQSSGVKSGGKSEGSRGKGHGSSESRQSSHGYYS
ncbi:hypothetical protein MCOR25_003142 [Pyricularia grisea]|uniref:Uncharacterized protein n=1 Tax=Pyricularia grisea TaxID=148305 RepID=A0A6P8B090_PYRGI|nr:uncharacterized protein PgNI_07070 [Pyricularia grisea]KAI6374679.1 hypothetical protein MCOR25_003142 [Pyricularia grisea]TLD08262.1 hypothetical protein PgNI_07070 [Pyricularia grisea]